MFSLYASPSVRRQQHRRYDSFQIFISYKPKIKTEHDIYIDFMAATRRDDTTRDCMNCDSFVPAGTYVVNCTHIDVKRTQ